MHRYSTQAPVLPVLNNAGNRPVLDDSPVSSTPSPRVGLRDLQQGMSKRIVIIGNSGSGKSYLARRLGAGLKNPVVHLDSIFWLPGGFNEKRAAPVVDQMIEHHRSEPEWIVEGVFGELAGRFLDLADLLIWLDLPWSLCEASLRARGSESSKQRDPTAAEENFQKLILWSSEYWIRTSPSSHLGHQILYDSFERAKFRFENRSDVDALAEGGENVRNQAQSNSGSRFVSSDSRTPETPSAPATSS